MPDAGKSETTEPRANACGLGMVRAGGLTGLPALVRGALIIYRGEPHILSVVHDVTERERAFQLLEQRVDERTRSKTSINELLRD